MKSLTRPTFMMLLAASATVAGLSGADRTTSAASPALHPLTFIDERSGLAISAQLDTSAQDAGHWIVRVARGVYSGDAGAGLNVNSPTSAVINYDGPATFRTLGGGIPSSRAVRLHAQLDALHHTAEATLWDGNDQFHLVAKAADLAGLAGTMSSVESAIAANDAVALYPLLNARVLKTYSPAAFTTMWQSESTALGQVTSLRRLSVGQPQVTDQGYWYVAAEYSATVRTTAGTSSAGFRAFFIHEPSGWKLWTTVKE